MVQRIISGGQTGVDRAALDLALKLGMPCGGWCPRGRRAEDGRIPDRYPLRETASEKYPPRTALNIREADATLILARGPLVGGSALTLAIAEEKGKMVLVVDLVAEDLSVEAVRVWLAQNRVECLNIAGPRESENPGIHQQAFRFLTEVLGSE